MFGSFFGKSDSWNKIENNMIFFSKDKVLKLFKEFKIIYFNEKDEDGKTALGKKKHWNIFYVMAKKI